MNKLALTVGICTVMLVVSLATAQASLISNGDFSSGLTGWSYIGDVDIQNTPTYPFFSGDYAILGSDVARQNSSLWQAFNIPDNTPSVTVSFSYAFDGVDTALLLDDDAYAVLSQHVGWFFFIPIWNSTSLVHLESPGDFTTSGIFTGEVDTSYIRHFFTNNAAIIFSLDESGRIIGDRTNTWFAIDNVSVTANNVVPEPASLFLLSLGLLGARFFKKSRKNF